MDTRSLNVTKNMYFLFIAHITQLLLVTFCDTTAGIGSGMRHWEDDAADCAPLRTPPL